MDKFLQLMDATSISGTIERRRAVRTYTGRSLDEETREKIREALGEFTGPFGGRVRFSLIDRKEAAVSNREKLGTYGVILGAPSFIAAAVEPGERAMEQLGHVFEQVVLFLTSLGLGTCWLAGTFRRNAFAAAMGLHEKEILPVITPVGYASRVRGPIDILFKPLSGLRRRLPWSALFFWDSFDRPLNQEEAGRFAVPLEMVRIAPSASNKQPWRIVKKDGHFLFFLARDPSYGRGYGFDIQKIDMGIAMLHFEAAAHEAGLPGHWEEPAPGSGSTSALEHVMTWVSG